MEKVFGSYTASITRDDRGRIVAEVWHNESGKTLAISEVNTESDGWHWAKRVIEMRGDGEAA